MKTSSEKSTSTHATPANQAASQPFIQKAGGGGFVEPAVQSKAAGVQAKLTVNEPGDAHEQEADRMADKVVQRLANPEPTTVQKAAMPEEQVQREEEEQVQKSGMPEENIQRAEAASGAPAEPGPDFTSRLQSSKGGGSPLPAETRDAMESGFGADFSNVRVHTGQEAAGMSRDINAQAFTHGNDIYFNEGKYNPGSKDGQHLLAHELTHTVQQGGSETTSHIQKEGESTDNASTEELFVISDPNAYIRNDKLEKTEEKIDQWTEVKIKESKSDDKGVECVFVTSQDGSKEHGWTAKSNLYSLKWNPKDEEANYKSISDAYNNQMAAVNPVENYKSLKLSGSETYDSVTSLYPNQTDVSYLDAGFKTKYENLKKCFEDNGISVSAQAGLRHPLRSTIMNYAINVRDAASESIIHEANAVCRKYGIPIDWAHKDEAGKIDLKKSKEQAKLVCDKFEISSVAARGVKDFKGTVSNHNNGKAVDLTLSFSFDKTKKITYNEKEFEIDPVKEKSAQDAKKLENIASSSLTLLGKEASGLTRALSNDPVHWSETGK